MQLLCNGVVLDMESGATLTFKKTNPLFAFDAMACERTQSFSIPATPKNERIFELSKLPAFRGTGMRRRFNAELQEGTLVKRGYIYVDKYENGRYNAIFVTGELLGLQAIRNAGKIAELVNQDERLEYSGEGKDARDTLATWDEVRYRHETERIIPSWSLKGVIDECASRIGVTIQTEGIEGVRAIPSTLNRTGVRNVRLTSERAEGQTINVVGGGVFDGMITTDNATLQEFHTIAVPDGQGYYTEEWVYDQAYSIQVYKAEKNIVLTFPEDIPDNWMLADIGTPVYIIGVNLAGKSIKVSAGVKFLLLAEGDQLTERTGGPYPEREGGEFYTERVTFPLAGSNLTFDFSVLVESSETGDIMPGYPVWLRDNLPDATITDLLKMAAALTGKVLNYTDAEGVTFDALDFDTWETVNMTGKAVSEGEITRKFSDYAQHNTQRFAGWESTRDSERIRVEYTVDNNNIEEDKTLNEFGMSEGGVTYDDDITLVYVRDSNPGDVPTICKAGTESEWLQRIELQKNANLQHLCDASTSMSIRARMTLAEFESMGAKTAILYAGTRYVWTEATWSKNEAEIKIAKIA